MKNDIMKVNAETLTINGDKVQDYDIKSKWLLPPPPKSNRKN